LFWESQREPERASLVAYCLRCVGPVLVRRHLECNFVIQATHLAEGTFVRTADGLVAVLDRLCIFDACELTLKGNGGPRFHYWWRELRPATDIEIAAANLLVVE
jgi:hypothetical protein